MSKSHHHINDISNKAVEDWKRRNSVMFLECSVSLMLTHCSKERVCEILRQQARMIEELD